ncbi:MAG: hypothetical protein FWF35_01275 [Elusimicrobia bacterium]|nr:hypothetical protein [Elusimicrobiota bacterium]
MSQNEIKGFSREQIEQMCFDKGSQLPFDLPTVKKYGFSKCIREFAGLPSWFPITVEMQHGVVFNEKPLNIEINAPAYAVFFWYKYTLDEYPKYSKTRTYGLLAPFVSYRRKHNITQNSDAKGTLLFFSHTIGTTEHDKSVEEFIESFKNIPQEFYPLAVSVHMHDVEKGIHLKFLEKGVPVFTAGHEYHKDFPDRFYDMLRRFKYAASDGIGSHTMYAAEMGTPFFIFGRPPVLHYHGDTQYKGKINFIEVLPRYKAAYDLFNTGPSKTVTPQQRECALECLGEYISESPASVKKVLIKSLFYYIFIGWIKKNILKIKERSQRRRLRRENEEYLNSKQKY